MSLTDTAIDNTLTAATDAWSDWEDDLVREAATPDWRDDADLYDDGLPDWYDDDEAWERAYPPAPKHRPKGSLTLNGMKHRFAEGQRVFYTASHGFNIVEVNEVEAMCALPETHIFQDRPFEAFTTVRESSLWLGKCFSAHSTLDRNLIRNHYNDWFVFAHRKQAERFRKRGK
jgi:hypothetical protein